MLDFQAARWLIDGEVPSQAGNDHPTSIPTGVFKTSDGHINIATPAQNVGAAVRTLQRRRRWRENPDYATAQARSKNREALNAAIEDASTKPHQRRLDRRFNEAGVPCGPIYSIDQVFADPQVRHLGIAQSRRRERQARRGVSSASRSRCRARRAAWWRRRRSSASIPTPCSRNSAFPADRGAAPARRGLIKRTHDG